jgi:hypothetical protein
MFVWPYVRPHILCTQLVICLFEKGYNSRKKQPSVKSVIYEQAQIMANQDTKYE